MLQTREITSIKYRGEQCPATFVHGAGVQNSHSWASSYMRTIYVIDSKNRQDVRHPGMVKTPPRRNAPIPS